MIISPFEIELWENANGKSPVADFIDNFSERKKLHAQILEKLNHYEKIGFDAMQREETLCKISQSNEPLLEMKLKLSVPIRILGIRDRGTFIAFHAFEKKYEGNIKPKEIRIAESNFQIYKIQKTRYEITKLQKQSTGKRSSAK